MYHKMFCSVALVVCLAFLCQAEPSSAATINGGCGSGASHDARFGARVPGDRLLYTVHPAKGAQMLRKQSYPLAMPTPPGAFRQKITYIEALDQYRDGKGGCVSLEYGGPGTDFAVLQVESQRGGPINFIINVYGK